MLLVYLLFALAIAALTWRHWWLDARLAAPAHLLDMMVFTAIVFSTNGYTSPFFLFFILPLLSAAIRWGWRETLVTAIGLIILYLAAGLLVAGDHAFELQRFIVRSGHLVILSAILIWFGMHQQVTRLFFGVDELDRRLARDDDPAAQALGVAMDAAQARSGALLMALPRSDGFAGVEMSGGSVKSVTTEGPLLRDATPGVLLFDLRADRTLSRRPEGWFRFLPAGEALDTAGLRALGATEGLVAQVRTGTEQGWLVLWDVADLSCDFIELGAELGRAAGAVLDREALLAAFEEGAAARTRLSLARDVHDSLVQFLAGASIRVEAIMRSARTGNKVEAELKELKRLLIEEQGEIRAFVTALRRERELELAEAVSELEALARRLGDQWSVNCSVSATDDTASIPIRMQLDLQQLLREAVANAVRHGRADRIDVALAVVNSGLRMEVKDNGAGFAAANGTVVEPWSLKERVERAHGDLAVASQPGSTNVVITLPLAGAIV